MRNEVCLIWPEDSIAYQMNVSWEVQWQTVNQASYALGTLVCDRDRSFIDRRSCISILFGATDSVSIYKNERLEVVKYMS